MVCGQPGKNKGRRKQENLVIKTPAAAVSGIPDKHDIG